MREIDKDYTFNYVKSEGELYIPTSNRGGKKFQTWTFLAANRDQYEITVDLMYPSGDKSLRFSASSNHLSKTFESSDIEKLRITVNEDLQNRAHLYSNITWEEWYQVIVSGNNDAREGGKSELRIRYGKLKKGFDKNGSPITIHNNNVIVSFPTAKTMGKIAQNFLIEDGDEISYIPVTDKNTSMLEALTQRLGMLREDTAKFLSQDLIEESFKLGIDTKLLS